MFALADICMSHPYLHRKRVKAYGIKEKDEKPHHPCVFDRRENKKLTNDLSSRGKKISSRGKS